MMRNNLVFYRLSVILLLIAINSLVLAAKPPPKPPKVAPVVVDSVTVDWLNEKLVVRGSGFVSATSFLLGGSGALVTEIVTDTQVDIPFDAAMAAEVTSQGNYNLEVNGSVQLSVYIESQVIDPAATGCPCTSGTPDWATELGSLWGSKSTVCFEIEGSGRYDIAGTVLSLSDTTYPQYPIGASFYPGVPDDSVCKLVKVDNLDPPEVELVNKRINETQQSVCAELLEENVCVEVIPFP